MTLWFIFIQTVLFYQQCGGGVNNAQQCSTFGLDGYRSASRNKGFTYWWNVACWCNFCYCGVLKKQDWASKMKRYNRIQFILSQILIVCIFLVSIALSKYLKLLPVSWKGWYLITLFIMVFVITLIAIIKRLHDMGMSGFWVIAAILLSIAGKFFPDIVMVCVDTGIMIFFALMPGDKIENKYGPPSKKKFGLI